METPAHIDGAGKKKGRGRPPGQRNKTYSVELKYLNNVFAPDAKIPISKAMATMIKQMNASVPISEAEQVETGSGENKLDFSITE